jgi:hypothetical protein
MTYPNTPIIVGAAQISRSEEAWAGMIDVTPVSFIEIL